MQFIQVWSPVLFRDPELHCALFGKDFTLNLNLAAFGVSRVLMMLTLGASGAVFMKLMSNTTPKRKRGAVFGYRSLHCPFSVWHENTGTFTIERIDHAEK